MNDAKSKHYDLQHTYETMKTQNKIITRLMQIKKEGRLAGIHGRLGNLGIIDQKYNLAITMACSQLNYIVVETVKDAQDCINYLRENKLGRGVFLCMDQIPEINQKKLSLEIPNNSQRLFNLIKPKDSIYARVFYHVIRDTLVVNDLISANKVAFSTPRWRVVTLKGQVIDTSGTMSGGGQKVFGGGMGSEFLNEDFVDEKDLKLVEAEKEKCQNTYNNMFQKKHKLNAQLNNLKQSKASEIETKNIKLNMEIKAIENQMLETESQLKAIQYNCLILEGISQHLNLKIQRNLSQKKNSKYILKNQILI